MRFTTALLGAAIGGIIGTTKGDPFKYAVWGGGIGLVITLVGGAGVSIGGMSFHVGADSGTDVAKAQAMLTKLGFHVETNGVLGPLTMAALKVFQTTNALQKADGTINPETLQYLQMLTNPGAVLPGVQ
jgi:hypothetical protein